MISDVAMKPLTEPGDISDILNACHADPFSVLGIHRAAKGGEPGWVVRVCRPDAQRLWVVLQDSGKAVEAKREHREGFFEAWIPGCDYAPAYSLRWEDGQHETHGMVADPYSYGPILGDQDMYYLGEGTHRKLYRALGANRRVVGGKAGILFAVWAPNARRVSVVGDFNLWDGRIHPMRKRIEAGIWEIFIPGLGFGEHYKYEIVGEPGNLFAKSDPVAFFGQTRGLTASLTYNLDAYEWNDADWIQERAHTNIYERPLSIYEAHLDSWARVPEDGGRNLTYREFADRLVAHVKDLGFTHIELMPITEHPFDGSWGYQTTGYFAPTSRYGAPDDFRFFVDRCHQEGIGIILDWVPAHFPKDANGLAWFDGTSLYEHANPLEGEHRDWGTLIFNFGRNEVRNFLLSSALFWLEEYHIDGLRVDAVASMLYRDYSRKQGEWVPNQYGGRENLEAIDFLRQLNQVCYEEHPGILMMAEESTAFGGVSRPVETGGLGFGFKWNMGWMHDQLLYMSKDPIHRRHHHDTATFSMLYAYDENFVLVLSHDEVVHGKKSLLDKMPGDNWQKFANLRMFLAWMFGHPGKKLLFQGTELAPFTEWNHEKSVDWHLLQYPEHKGIYCLLRDLNRLYRAESPLHELDHSGEGFDWVDANDAGASIFSFLRYDKKGDPVLVVVNATPVPRHNHRLGVPVPGFWKELINTDATIYAGSGLGNAGGVTTSGEGSHGRPYSLQLSLPPLAALYLKPVG